MQTSSPERKQRHGTSIGARLARFQQLLVWLRSLLIDASRNVGRVQPFRAAAALSFYAVFSLAPLVLVIVAIAGLFFSDIEVQNALIERIRTLISNDAAVLVETIIENTKNESRNVFSLVLGGAVMLIGATTAFAELHGVLNQMWSIDSPGRRAMLRALQGRLWSFAFLLLIGLLLVASLLLSTLLDTFNDFLSTHVIVDESFWSQLDLYISYVVTTVLIATIYKFLPDVPVAWRDAFIGGVVATLLFDLSKSAIEFYVAQLSPESSFGAAGSVIVFLLWIYCASLIVLVGAGFCRASALRRSG